METRKNRLMGWMIRWAYLMEPDGYIPTRASFCELFWRSVLKTPLILFAGIAFAVVILGGLAFVAGIVLWLIGTAVVWTHIVVIPTLLILAVLLVLSEHVMRARHIEIDAARDFLERVEAHPVSRAVADVHRGICPIIDLTPYRD